jgi:transposase
MRKIIEILRLHFEKRLHHRAIGHSVSVSPATVGDCLGRARAAGIAWPLPDDLDEAQLEARLYDLGRTSAGKDKAQPDCAYLHKELRRKGVTLMLLWQEYKANHPEDGYQYSRFCDIYQRFHGSLDLVLRQEHRAGEKTFVDFSGDGVPITDPTTGEVREAPVFVAVLGASSYAYAEACESEETRFWVEGHIHAFEFFGGVSELVVPDNTRTAVSHPCRYDPDINRTYLELARHYRTAVLPARVRKPRDKAKVENAVLVVQRWILAALRNHTFFSVAEANQAIWKKLAELNERKFEKLDSTRRQLFETVDRPALHPLPKGRFEYADWSSPTVNVDYHVEIDGHFYSVPHPLHNKRVEARFTLTSVEIFFKGNRVASHVRSYRKGGATTCKEHMPERHQKHLEWTPERIRDWAGQAGPSTARMAEAIMQSRPHPELGYRACLGLIRLGQSYGNDRLEAACRRALAIGARSYQSVKSILKTGLDQQQLELVVADRPIAHDNLRGPDYYH